MDQIRKIQQTQDFPSGHQRAIYCICSFQNNSKIATGGEDNTIRLWDLQNMECYLILKGHTDGIRDLISLPNGYLISASYDKTIKMWNIPQQLAKQDEIARSIIAKMESHFSQITKVALFADKVIVSSSADGTVKFWDLNIKQCVHSLEGHKGPCISVKYVQGNCMQIAQEFKCTYKMMKCTDNDNGECECEDGSICKWTNKKGDDNCPCGKPQPRRRRRRVGDL
ncbi:WD40 repeat protein [Ichthyophthirius multifiliis]|uniref:WD40 repeat protein n=1 Tax=Ichthyophthirius multifiliis TaxID=5932 RepID=G0QQE6_ICHMU|nr:WD40 repeat protein [Ichthyophthirius multifiliis]EGR32555.1 WD40 repeat protein [Ichthyophthirius multifiliis]|eukprot:XP_004036541.1 WD40 repeat protein [Ichthyophthirius multifiliis]